MTSLSYEIETVELPKEDIPELDQGEATEETEVENILHINIASKTASEMEAVYCFTDDQSEMLEILLAELDSVNALFGDLRLQQEDARELLNNLPETLSPERREVVENALKLVGKVNYFWGGKSLTIGWDNRWGVLSRVWADGSETTGTWRPFGLDCSGFVDWVFFNASKGAYVIGHGGGAASQHSYCKEISWSDVQPGDLVFYEGDTHVGIVGGWDDNGNLRVIHCSSSNNNVVITGADGFSAAASPQYF